MNKNAKTNIELLKKRVLIILYFLITFFALKQNVFAQYTFTYSSFDFDTFAKENIGYWTSLCEKDSDDPKNCLEKTLASQRNFYTRLYKILAKYEKQGITIDDNIIIATVYYELSPDMLSDNSKEIDSNYNTGNLIMGSAYNYDSDDLDNYSVDTDEDQDYLESETDTLKLLIKQMVGYKYDCYGIYPMKTVQTQNGSTQECTGGSSIQTTVGTTLSCAEDVDSGAIGFWDKFPSFFGIKSNKESDCENLISSKGVYESTFYDVSKTKQLVEDNYWQFLEEGKYFDLKEHLQSKYAAILKASGFKNMAELDNNVEAYDKYYDQIKEVRQGIIDDIKEIVKSYENENPIKYKSTNNNLLWWPIGSDDTTEENGKTYASSTPTTSSISSNYGQRTDPISGNVSFHKGLDIVGSTSEAGVVNVIAVKDGVVTEVETGCTSFGDTSCGGGYGNHIIISHSNGTYTMYAHLHENSITVALNDSVKQGEVIGKMGSSGYSTGTHLHFEVRSDATTQVNPNDYISLSNPRPSNTNNLNIVNNGNAEQSVCLSLKNSGFSDNGIAGILTNMNAESGFNPNALGDSGTSYGLCQWHNERWTRLKQLYPDSWEKVDGQISYLLYELDKGYSSLLTTIKTGSDTAYNIAHDYCFYFEVPANRDSTCTGRANNSSTFYNYVTNNCS